MEVFCSNCGAQLINGACPNCSEAQAAAQYQQPGAQYQQPAGQYQQPNAQYQQQNYQYQQQPAVEVNPKDERFKSFFMNPNEKFICALGNGYLLNFFANGFLGRGFAVVSDKRVYFKGKAFEIGVKKLNVRTSASTVDLKDVTGTEVRTFNPIAVMILGFVFMGLGIMCLTLLPTVKPHSPGAGMLLSSGLPLLVFSFLFLLAYKLSKKTLLSINYAGGSIAFDINWYPRKEGEDFQKMLRIAKDQAVEEAENAAANALREAMSVSAPQPQQTAAYSAADELAKYAQLYKDGMISEQEFADIKARLLTKQ